jgi:hypothetical protein
LNFRLDEHAAARRALSPGAEFYDVVTGLGQLPTMPSSATPRAACFRSERLLCWITRASISGAAQHCAACAGLASHRQPRFEAGQRRPKRQVIFAAIPISRQGSATPLTTQGRALKARRSRDDIKIRPALVIVGDGVRGREPRASSTASSL